MIYTTFQQLHQANACKNGYRKLAEHLGGVNQYGMNHPIALTEILESNGLDDCLWVLHYAAGDSGLQLSHELACDYAEAVLPIFEKYCPGDDRPRNAILAYRKYLNTKDAARAAARAAAWDAARDAAWDAAWDAARDAAKAAARAAAWDAAWDAARAAAWDAAKAAVWVAASAAAKAAVWVAARAAAWDAQTKLLKTRLLYSK
jgi:hypothetical protein